MNLGGFIWLYCWRHRLVVPLSVMESGWITPELMDSSWMAFSGIQDVPEFLRGLVDVTRSKGHLCLWLNRAQVSAVLQWWIFASIIIRAPTSPAALLFQVWVMGDKSHQITWHTSGPRLFDSDTHSSPPCLWLWPWVQCSLTPADIAHPGMVPAC